ncbi:hypothetical protein SAMN03159473_03394 [Pseudomonas sp. NFACC52]|nr:hypothetical protein SAMN03159481_03499 [Pseudomonas sp. NFACC56-3]SFK69869.1 hypothetical protein SAMN03159473_03394 [Pseudomonas sp. NFACC52]
MRCSVDKACYTFICWIRCAWSIAHREQARSHNGPSAANPLWELARDGRQLDPPPYTPAAFNRCACSTNNRTGSAPLPTSPSDWLTMSKWSSG